MTKLIRLVSIVALLCAAASVASAVVDFSEDWENGTDAWEFWGSPLPFLLDTGSNLAVDPNGDGWCASGVQTYDSFPWQRGSRVSFDVNTNINLDPRISIHQSYALGLSDGTLQTIAPCTEGNMVQHLSLYVAPESDQQEFHFQSGPITTGDQPYPADQDGIWHHAQFLNITPDGSANDVVEVRFDAFCDTLVLDGHLASQLHLAFEGRSYQLNSAVDNIEFSHSSDTFYEDWQAGTDVWDFWGSPASYLADSGGGNLAIDPNGDGWCNSGVQTSEAFNWLPGSILTFRYNTNINLEARELYHQTYQIGLSDGTLATSAPCNEGNMNPSLTFFVGPEADYEYYHFQWSGVSTPDQSYPSSMDGDWHEVMIANVTPAGAASDSVIFRMDDYQAQVSLGSHLAELMHVWIGGRSVGITSLFDDIELRKAVAAVASFDLDIDFGAAPLTVSFTNASTGDIAGYDWDFGDGSASQDASPVHDYTVPGIYTVTMTAHGFLGDTVATATVTVLGNAPTLLAVDDIPDEQGGWVHVSFLRSAFDNDPLLKNAESYSVQRLAADQWVTVGSAGAYGEDQYLFAAPTTLDGTTETFRVLAHMDEGNWASNELEGMSIDNIVPPAPAEVLVAYSYQPEGGVQAVINWDAVSAPDLDAYLVYRQSSESFDPELAVLAGSTLGTSFTISGLESTGDFFFVAAADDGGNVSDATAMSNPASPVGLPQPALTLAQNHPNPFNPQTTISFNLPAAGQVQLRIYNLDGSLVRTLLQGPAPEGRNEIQWTGDNDAGRQMASGTYFYRLETEQGVLSRRMVLLK